MFCIVCVWLCFHFQRWRRIPRRLSHVSAGFPLHYANLWSQVNWPSTYCGEHSSSLTCLLPSLSLFLRLLLLLCPTLLVLPLFAFKCSQMRCNHELGNVLQYQSVTHKMSISHLLSLPLNNTAALQCLVTKTTILFHFSKWKPKAFEYTSGRI